MKLPRATYQGRKRGLLIAFDVGTTYSGASYAYALNFIVALSRLPNKEYYHLENLSLEFRLKSRLLLGEPYLTIIPLNHAFNPLSLT